MDSVKKLLEGLRLVRASALKGQKYRVRFMVDSDERKTFMGDGATALQQGRTSFTVGTVLQWRGVGICPLLFYTASQFYPLICFLPLFYTRARPQPCISIHFRFNITFATAVC